MTLTDKQKQIIGLILKSIKEVGCPPSRIEICKAMGFSSPNAAQVHLVALEKKGVITITPNISRGIKVNEDRLAALSI